MESLLDAVGPQNTEQLNCLVSVNSYNGTWTGHGRESHQLYSGKARQKDTKARSKWPSAFWFLMKILGIFHQPSIVRRRKCFQCYVKGIKQESHDSVTTEDYTVLSPLSLAYDFDDSQQVFEEASSNSFEDDECELCNISRWDYLGHNIHHISDDTIGASPWNHRGSKYISFVILLILIVCLSQEIYFLWHDTWGKPDKLLHALSYGGYIGCLSVYPVMCICSKLRYCGDLQHMSSLTWAIVLNERFIFRRLQFLVNVGEGIPGKCFLFVCLIWPSLNVCYRGIISHILASYKPKLQDTITIPATELLLVAWGCFTYLLYIMRLSFQHQFEVVVFYVINREGQLDKCRHCISSTTMDFNCFRKFTQFYMAIIISLNVLGATTITSTQYRLTGTCYYEHHFVEQLNLYILIWSTILMFVSLSMIAIGGLDLNSTWRRFKLSIIQASNSANYKFWQTLLKHITRVGDIDSTVSYTVIFSVIGLYTGLRLEENQDLSYYGSNDNCTDWNITTSSFV